MDRIAEGVYRIARAPFFTANAYLLEDVLVDAMTRAAGPYLARELCGRALSAVVLTHAHPDHQGAAAHICRTRGVPLACHAADAPAVEGRAPMLRNPLIRLAGRVWEGPPYPVSRVLFGGEEFAGFRVIHAPGHTAGHIVLFRERDGIAVCGDLLSNMHPVTRRAHLEEPPPWLMVNTAQNRRSLRLLATFQPRVLCFGHGPVLHDMARFSRFVRRLPS